MKDHEDEEGSGASLIQKATERAEQLLSLEKKTLEGAKKIEPLSGPVTGQEAMVTN